MVGPRAAAAQSRGQARSVSDGYSAGTPSSALRVLEEALGMGVSATGDTAEAVAAEVPTRYPSRVGAALERWPE